MQLFHDNDMLICHSCEFLLLFEMYCYFCWHGKINLKVPFVSNVLYLQFTKCISFYYVTASIKYNSDLDLRFISSFHLDD